MFNDVDWQTVFLPDTPLLEIFVRGSVIYLAIFFTMRVVLKRQIGSLGLTDVLVIVLIADAAQNGMAGDYRSIIDGVLLILTIVFWSAGLEWLSYHWSFFAKLTKPRPLLLIEDGRMLQKNMRKELITKEELLGRVRENGLLNINQVEMAMMEDDGTISVIPRKNNS